MEQSLQHSSYLLALGLHISFKTVSEVLHHQDTLLEQSQTWKQVSRVFQVITLTF